MKRDANKMARQVLSPIVNQSDFQVELQATPALNEEAELEPRMWIKNQSKDEFGLKNWAK